MAARGMWYESASPLYGGSTVPRHSTNAVQTPTSSTPPSGAHHAGGTENVRRHTEAPAARRSIGTLAARNGTAATTSPVRPSTPAKASAQLVAPANASASRAAALTTSSACAPRSPPPSPLSRVQPAGGRRTRQHEREHDEPERDVAEGHASDHLAPADRTHEQSERP